MVSCIPGKDFRGVRFLPIGGDDKKEEKVETPTPIVEEKEESVKEEESGNPFAEKEEKKDESKPANPFDAASEEEKEESGNPFGAPEEKKEEKAVEEKEESEEEETEEVADLKSSGPKHRFALNSFMKSASKSLSSILNKEDSEDDESYINNPT